jgi:hypothetical protein
MSKQEIIEDSTPLVYHLFVKFVIKNKENRNDWIYSTTAEISDAEIAKCLRNKQVTEIVFPFDKMLRLSMECKVEFTVYWINSEGVRSENTIVYSEIHIVDEDRQKMFVIARDDEEDVIHIKLSSSSEEEEDEKQEHGNDQSIDIFADKKTQERELALLRQKKNLMKITEEEERREAKRKLEEHDENIIKTFKDENEEKKEQRQDDEDFEQVDQVLIVAEQPICQNDSGAYQMQELVCFFDIKKVLNVYFPDVEQHFNKII